LVSDGVEGGCRAARELVALGSIHRDLTHRRCRCWCGSCGSGSRWS
jgi:hypothetical protein